MANKTIDDFFKPTSKTVAQQLIGMNIESKNGIYVVSATKPYLWESRQTRNRPRVIHGTIMMFNMRGHPHFCISTGQGREQDYVFINQVVGEGGELTSARAVSEALGLSLADDGRWFSDYFKLSGKTQPSTFELYQGDAASCLGVFELKKS